MKKTFNLFVLAILMASCSSEDSSAPVQDNPQSKAVNETSKLFGGGSITFGIGRTSRDCAGFSICKIKKVSVIIEDHTITWTNQNRPSMTCGYLKVDSNNFYLLVDKAIIAELRTIEGGNDFIFDEAFTFDPTTTSTIGISSGFTVGVGRSPIVYDAVNDIYKILITNSTP